MDVFGCSGPDTWLDRALFWFAIVGMFLSVFLGVPFLIWIAVSGPFL